MSDARAVQEVLARYVRATDRRDGAAMSTLFVSDGRVRIFHNEGGSPIPVAQLEGAAAIGDAVGGMMQPHPPNGWSHHTTMDPIVEVEGSEAEIDVQFIVYETIGAETPVGGWPEGTMGAQGSVRPIEAGYYRSTLRRTAEGWKIFCHDIILDLPPAFPPDPEGNTGRTGRA